MDLLSAAVWCVYFMSTVCYNVANGYTVYPLFVRWKMKVAVIGSRGLTVSNIEDYLPEDTTEIVSGGAKGVDASARNYALAHGIKLTEFLPEYTKFRRNAPYKRSAAIVEYSDLVIAFWDGQSKGTKFVIDECRRTGTPVKVITIADEERT